MAELTITHTPAEGTMLDGSRKGDGVWEILRDAPMNWRASRNVGLYVRGSRDKPVPDRRGIERAAELLREAGHTVTVTYGDEARSVAEVEADRAQRADDRADRFGERAERRQAEGDSRRAAADAMSEHLPFGEPIKVGHHSERRHRNYITKIQTHTEKSWDAYKAAREAARRAESARVGQSFRESGPATMRRIERLETELRKFQRSIDGGVRHQGSPYEHVDPPAAGQHREDLLALAADREGKIEYWREHLAKLEAEGQHKVWGPDDFGRGDLVLERYGWSLVLRVNKKSLSVPHPEPRLAEAGHTWTVSYDRVKKRAFGKWSVVTKSGTAMPEATLCREHLADEKLRALAEEAARGAEDAPRKLKWVSSTMNTEVRCSACAPELPKEEGAEAAPEQVTVG